MPSLKIFLLGPPAIELEGQPIEVPRRKLWALLAYLCLSDTPCRRDTVAALIWPEVDQPRARLALSRHLSELKQLVGEEWLRIEHEVIGLHRSPTYWSDVGEFRHLINTYEYGEANLEGLITTAALYRGDFLTGFTLSDSPEFDAWQSQQCEALRQSLASLLERLSQCLNDRGNAAAALPVAQRWLALDPYHEPAHRQLMRLYATTGQHSAALRQYRHCAQLLADEFQASPSVETVDLYRQIVEGRFHAANSGSSPIEAMVIVSPRHNLSPPLTLFVGRADDLALLERWLSNPEVRLVTILGPGGIGKSRFAMEVGLRHAARFANGVWFVPLASLDVPGGTTSVHPLATALVDVLPAAFHGDAPLAEQVLAYLENKEMLIVFDNFEHLISLAGLVSDLLRRAPRVKVVATSRTRLNLREEWLFVLDGLPVPTNASLEYMAAPDSAVALFQQHAKRVRQDFDLVAERDDVLRICRLVEGMPLGIELAAPWVRLMSGAEIVAEIERNVDFPSTSLQNVPKRHRSLRAVFEHSWRLLASEDQAVLMRLSILHGFARPAAEAVAGATIAQLSTLIDHSLLKVTADRRYAIHEHVRHFALEQLQRMPGAYEQASIRHCQVYLGFVESEGLRLCGPHVKAAVAALTADIENVRAAWRWAQEQDRFDDLARAVEALGLFYEIKGWFAEGLDLFSQSVAWLRPRLPHTDMGTSGADGRLAHVWQLLLSRLLGQQGWFLARAGRHQEARQAIEASLDLLAPLGDQALHDQALAQYFLGDVLFLAGKPAEAVTHYQDSIEQFAQLGDSYGMGIAQVGLCQALTLWGHYEEAESAARQGIEILSATGEQLNVGYALSALGRVAQARGQYALAEAIFQECLQLRLEIGDRTGTAFTLRYLGDSNRLQGRWEQAHTYYEECLAQAEAMNLPEAQIMAFYGLGGLALMQNDPDVALRCFQAGLSLCGDGETPFVAPGEVGVGWVALQRHDLVTAKQHLQVAVALSGTGQAPKLAFQPLAVWAEYLAQAGATQQAIITAEFLMQNTTINQESRDVAAKVLDAMAATLPAEDFAALQARGRNAVWEEIVENALADYAG